MAASLSIESECRKPSKAKRKLLKKQKRSQHTLLKHSQLETVAFATRHLLVASGGLGNNVTYNELETIFCCYGDKLDILMPPEVPYAFVSYRDQASAEHAYNAVNGKFFNFSQVCHQHVQLCLSFIETVPKIEVVGYEGYPPGLVLLEDFISEEEEKQMLECLDWNQQHKDNSKAQKTLKHRKVKHYGYEFIYGKNNVDPDNPLEVGIPAVCDPFIERLCQTGHVDHIPDQLTVNCYEPGQGIPPHIDTHSAFEDAIVSLSLQSQVVMNFKHPDGRHAAVALRPRSVLIMKSESRYMWTHGITPKKSDVVPLVTKDSDNKLTSDGESKALLPCGGKSYQPSGGSGRIADTKTTSFTVVNRSTRTSFTFRKVLRGPCICSYPDQCDSQNEEQQQPR